MKPRATGALGCSDQTHVTVWRSVSWR